MCITDIAYYTELAISEVVAQLCFRKNVLSKRAAGGCRRASFVVGDIPLRFGFAVRLLPESVFLAWGS